MEILECIVRRMRCRAERSLIGFSATRLQSSQYMLHVPARINNCLHLSHTPTHRQNIRMQIRRCNSQITVSNTHRQRVMPEPPSQWPHVISNICRKPTRPTTHWQNNRSHPHQPHTHTLTICCMFGAGDAYLPVPFVGVRSGAKYPPGHSNMQLRTHGMCVAVGPIVQSALQPSHANTHSPRPTPPKPPPRLASAHTESKPNAIQTP